MTNLDRVLYPSDVHGGMTLSEVALLAERAHEESAIPPFHDSSLEANAIYAHKMALNGSGRLFH